MKRPTLLSVPRFGNLDGAGSILENLLAIEDPGALRAVASQKSSLAKLSAMDVISLNGSLGLIGSETFCDCEDMSRDPIDREGLQRVSAAFALGVEAGSRFGGKIGSPGDLYLEIAKRTIVSEELLPRLHRFNDGLFEAKPEILTILLSLAFHWKHLKFPAEPGFLGNVAMRGWVVLGGAASGVKICTPIHQN